MIGGLSTSHSGLQHLQRRLEASTHNTANLTTAKTTVVRVTGREEPPGRGVVSQASGRTEIRTSTDGVASPTASRGGAPFVQEAVEQISIAHQAGALRRAVQTQDEMLGILLDITG